MAHSTLSVQGLHPDLRASMLTGSLPQFQALLQNGGAQPWPHLQSLSHKAPALLAWGAELGLGKRRLEPAKALLVPLAAALGICDLPALPCAHASASDVLRVTLPLALLQPKGARLLSSSSSRVTSSLSCKALCLTLVHVLQCLRLQLLWHLVSPPCTGPTSSSGHMILG